jgi:hypothetical protein
MLQSRYYEVIQSVDKKFSLIFISIYKGINSTGFKLYCKTTIVLFTSSLFESISIDRISITNVVFHYLNYSNSDI